MTKKNRNNTRQNEKNKKRLWFLDKDGNLGTTETHTQKKRQRKKNIYITVTPSDAYLDKQKDSTPQDKKKQKTKKRLPRQRWQTPDRSPVLLAPSHPRELALLSRVAADHHPAFRCHHPHERRRSQAHDSHPLDLEQQPCTQGREQGIEIDGFNNMMAAIDRSMQKQQSKEKDIEIAWITLW